LGSSRSPPPRARLAFLEGNENRADIRTPSDAPPPHPPRTSGQVNAAVSSAVVGLFSKHVGRGPTKARTLIDGNLVVVLLRDGMTTAERSLVRAGKEAEVQQVRRAFQDTMAADLVDTVERLTNGKVAAFMSANHSEPDVAAEIFVMDRSVGDAGDEPPA
jgi:uncharacterized protein YbcI